MGYREEGEEERKSRGIEKEGKKGVGERRRGANSHEPLPIRKIYIS